MADAPRTPPAPPFAGPALDERVEVVGVSKSLGTHRAVDDVTLQLRGNEKVTLIGPSGSGKSTLLRIVAGLETPDAGVVRIAGEQLWPSGPGPARARKRLHERAQSNIGMVSQFFDLFPHLTARENVTLALRRVKGASKEQARATATEMLERVGLRVQMDRRPAQLSGGEQQRAALARAMALRPRLMLFDEVTSALDPEVVTEVLAVIEEMTDAHDTAVIMITHVLSFARRFSDRVVMLDHGSVVESGPPEQVLASPVEERTKRFIAALLDRTGE